MKRQKRKFLRLSLKLQEADLVKKPITFKRGQTFSFIFVMELPEAFPERFFENWRITCQLRKERTKTPSGHIADIPIMWVNEERTAFLVHHSITEDWALGRADLDILLESSGGHKLRTQTVPFIIKQDVTHD